MNRLTLVPLLFLFSCSGNEKLARLEKAVHAQEQELRALRKDGESLAKAKEDLKSQRSELDKLASERTDLLQKLEQVPAVKKLENEVAQLKAKLAESGGGERVVQRYQSGQKMSEGYMLDDGTKVGHWTEWGVEGRKSSEGVYKEGLKSGAWTYWHVNGQKREEGLFKNGEPDQGVWKCWYANGQQKQVGAYTSGNRVGKWTTWYEAGQKSSEGSYVNGKREGVWHSWHEDGKEAAGGSFYRGQRDGTWTFTSPSGIAISIPYSPAATPQARWTDSGWLVDGKKEGPWTYRHAGGDRKEAGAYASDRREGSWLSWHDNGQKASEGAYKNGERDGNWTSWHSNGQKSIQETFKNGKHEGTCIAWHKNGQKSSEGAYRNDVREGAWVVWHEDGSKSAEGLYESGLREGEWTLTTPEGVALKFAYQGGVSAEMVPFGSLEFRNQVATLRKTGLEIVFVFDSTGSMTRTIMDTKGTIVQMLDVLHTLVPDARIGLVAFRDRGRREEYLVRQVPLDLDYWRATNFVQFVVAEGGGDKPEDVRAGLRAAFTQKWRPNTRRVVVLAGDAPTHAEDLKSMLTEVREFANNRRSFVHTLITNPELAGMDTERQFKKIAKAGRGTCEPMENRDRVLQRVLTLAIGSKYDEDIQKAIHSVSEERVRVDVASLDLVRTGGPPLTLALKQSPVPMGLWNALVRRPRQHVAESLLTLLVDPQSPSHTRHACAAALQRILQLRVPPIDPNTSEPLSKNYFARLRSLAKKLPE